ncbi:hypothetical protein ACFQYP_15170 [Nonomuraea antimicrobica]
MPGPVEPAARADRRARRRRGWLAIVGTGGLLAGSWLAVFGPLAQLGYGLAALLLSVRIHRTNTRMGTT